MRLDALTSPMLHNAQPRPWFEFYPELHNIWMQRQAPCLSCVLGSVDVEGLDLDQSAEMVHMAIKRQNFVC